MYITGDSMGPPVPAVEQEEGTRHAALAATATPEQNNPAQVREREHMNRGRSWIWPLGLTVLVTVLAAAHYQADLIEARRAHNA